MSNIIEFKKTYSTHNPQQNSDVIAKKALVLAQIHNLINEAENTRKTLYEKYTKAFQAGTIKEMNIISREITEAGGKLSALRKCENLVHIYI